MVVLVGYLVMLAGVARGSTPLPDLTVAQVALGVFVVLLWGAVTQAGLPRVVVSTGLVEIATHAELLAVLSHEDFHRRHRDPLRVLAFRTWAAAFFFIPILGAVLRRALDRQEPRADRAAVRACGVPPVAGALLKAARRSR